MATLAYRILILGLGVMALVGQATQLDGAFWNATGLAGGWGGDAHPAYTSMVAMDAVLTLCMVGLAALLGFHRERGRGARPLGLTVAVWAYLLGYSGLITLLRPEDPGSLLRLLFQGHFLLVEMLGLAALLRFSALFPRPLAPGDLARPETVAPGLVLLQRVRLRLLAPAGPWIAAALATGATLAVNALLGHDPTEAALLVLVDGIRFTALTLVVLNLRRGYLLSVPAERESARWLGVGFALLVGSLGVLMGGNVLSLVTGWRVPYLNWRPLILDLGLLGFVWGTAMGALYRGPVRSGPVGRNVVLLSVLATSTLLLASGLEALLSDAVLVGLDLPRGIGTGAAVATMGLLYLRFSGPLGRVLEESVRGSVRAASERDRTPIA